jgi:hypothetical protein
MTECYAGVVANAETYRLAIWPHGVRFVYARSAVGLKELADELKSQAPSGILILREADLTQGVDELAPSLLRELLAAGVTNTGARLAQANPWQVTYYLGLPREMPVDEGMLAELASRVNLTGERRRKQPRPQLAQVWPPLPLVDEPARSDVLWRYYDLPKFVSLLERQALYLARADTLGDIFEGTYPVANASYHDPDAASAAHLLARRQRAREEHFVSCWYQNELESVAMWELYASRAAGIAIRTTYARLYDAIDENALTEYESLFFTRVRYLDYDRDAFETYRAQYDVLTAYFHKFRSFEHEHEVRIVLPGPLQCDTKLNSTAVGVYLPVDLRLLIESVYVAPAAPFWFQEVVQAVMTKWGMTSVPVVRSDLSRDPMY